METEKSSKKRFDEHDFTSKLEREFSPSQKGRDHQGVFLLTKEHSISTAYSNAPENKQYVHTADPILDDVDDFIGRFEVDVKKFKISFQKFEILFPNNISCESLRNQIAEIRKSPLMLVSKPNKISKRMLTSQDVPAPSISGILGSDMCGCFSQSFLLEKFQTLVRQTKVNSKYILRRIVMHAKTSHINRKFNNLKLLSNSEDIVKNENNHSILKMNRLCTDFKAVSYEGSDIDNYGDSLFNTEEKYGNSKAKPISSLAKTNSEFVIRNVGNFPAEQNQRASWKRQSHDDYSSTFTNTSTSIKTTEVITNNILTNQSKLKDTHSLRNENFQISQNQGYNFSFFDQGQIEESKDQISSKLRNKVITEYLSETIDLKNYEGAFCDNERSNKFKVRNEKYNSPTHRTLHLHRCVNGEYERATLRMRDQWITDIYERAIIEHLTEPRSEWIVTPSPKMYMAETKVKKVSYFRNPSNFRSYDHHYDEEDSPSKVKRPTDVSRKSFSSLHNNYSINQDNYLMRLNNIKSGKTIGFGGFSNDIESDNLFKKKFNNDLEGCEYPVYEERTTELIARVEFPAVPEDDSSYFENIESNNKLYSVDNIQKGERVVWCNSKRNTNALTQIKSNNFGANYVHLLQQKDNSEDGNYFEFNLKRSVEKVDSEQFDVNSKSEDSLLGLQFVNSLMIDPEKSDPEQTSSRKESILEEVEIELSLKKQNFVNEDEFTKIETVESISHNFENHLQNDSLLSQNQGQSLKHQSPDKEVVEMPTAEQRLQNSSTEKYFMISEFVKSNQIINDQPSDTLSPECGEDYTDTDHKNAKTVSSDDTDENIGHFIQSKFSFDNFRNGLDILSKVTTDRNSLSSDHFKKFNNQLLKKPTNPSSIVYYNKQDSQTSKVNLPPASQIHQNKNNMAKECKIDEENKSQGIMNQNLDTFFIDNDKLDLPYHTEKRRIEILDCRHQKAKISIPKTLGDERSKRTLSCTSLSSNESIHNKSFVYQDQEERLFIGTLFKTVANDSKFLNTRKNSVQHVPKNEKRKSGSLIERSTISTKTSLTSNRSGCNLGQLIDFKYDLNPLTEEELFEIENQYSIEVMETMNRIIGESKTQSGKHVAENLQNAMKKIFTVPFVIQTRRPTKRFIKAVLYIQRFWREIQAKKLKETEKRSPIKVNQTNGGRMLQRKRV
jgi:hypothetical protein